MAVSTNGHDERKNHESTRLQFALMWLRPTLRPYVQSGVRPSYRYDFGANEVDYPYLLQRRHGSTDFTIDC
jgi:hypothetical protein